MRTVKNLISLAGPLACYDSVIIKPWLWFESLKFIRNLYLNIIFTKWDFKCFGVFFYSSGYFKISLLINIYVVSFGGVIVKIV